MAVNRPVRYLLVGLLIVAAFILIRTAQWLQWQDWLRPVLERPLAIGYAWGQDIGGSYESSPAAEQASLEQKVQSLQRENDELRRELELPRSPDLNEVAVEVIGRRQDESAITYLVNRGSQSGIKAGLAVTSQGSLVGTVMRVTATSSEIFLLTSPLNIVTAEVQNAVASRGVAQGEFNLAILLSLIPSGDDLTTGSAVVTSGLDELIPRGLPIGTVASVDYTEGDFFKSAVIIPTYDITKARFLRVILR